jgi:hypothetical protein
MAMIKFTDSKRKNIVCCIHDLTDTYTSGWAKEISINLSDYMIHRFDLHEFDIYIGNDEQELLTVAANNNYTHAVIIAAGTYLGLSDKIFTAIETLCEKEFFIAGHILDRNTRGWELHHQFYVVHLPEYLELDCPPIDNGSFFVRADHTIIAPLRSEESLYDDPEVPVWIRPGSTEVTYTHKLHGWDIIDLALRNNKVLIDLGEEIRNNKKYVYYEYDHVFVREISSVYYNQFFCNNYFSSWNSDGIQDHISIDKPVEQYVTVGIGLNWVKNLIKLNYTKDATVIFTDINYNCLRFMKALVTEWDGENYAEFYRSQIEFEINNSYVSDINSLIRQTDSQWQEFRLTFDNWPEVWQNVKQLNYKFVPIDYTSEYKFDFFESGKSTFLNFSDLFNHSPYMHTLSLKYRVAAENRLFNKLKEKDPDAWVLLTSRATDGFHPNNNRIRYGKVKDFDRTDMNDLKSPPWHKDEWSVICLLTGERKLLT